MAGGGSPDRAAGGWAAAAAAAVAAVGAWELARCLGQVQEALAAIQAAAPDGRGMAVVNLREARDVLRTRLGEVRLEPDALAEANALLEEVDAYLA